MLTRLRTLSLPLHGLATAGAFGLFQIARTRLDASYAASGYPVDYATGQLSFSAERLEGVLRRDDTSRHDGGLSAHTDH